MKPTEQVFREAIAMQRAGRQAEAAAIYRRILKRAPNDPNALHLLGLSEREQGRLHPAIEFIERAIRARDDVPEFHANLGATCLAVGLADRAVRHLRQALELRPDFAGAHSNLLLAEQYRPEVDPEQLLALHRAWNERHAAPLRSEWRPFDDERDPERPLRVGFVSPDLHVHPVGIFLVGVIERLDPERFATTCYATKQREDAIQARLREGCGAWVDARPLDDAVLARRIRADRIDVLFDLSGHTAGHRLLAFARRPAPVQATWMGYVGTTGLDAIDWLFADARQVPEGAERCYAERVLRLPDDYVILDPPDPCPEVGPLPAATAGHLVFGCFNNPAKVTEATLDAWSAALRAVPDARMICKYAGFGERETRRRLERGLKERGVDPGRLRCLPRSPRFDLLDHYNRVDLALDTMPYTGGLTTMEALWMGVPTITIAGSTFAGRHALTHLSAVGLERFVAEDVPGFAAIARDAADDLEGLAALRAGLRARCAASPMVDADRHAAAVAEAIRAIWRERCEVGDEAYQSRSRS